MITPFGPDKEDLDRLNAILDAQVTGKRAPVSDPASDPDALAATARLVTGQPIQAREHASADTLDSIWRNIMQAQALHDSTDIAGPRPQAVRSTSRARSNPAPESAPSQSWLSIAAMTVLLLGIVGGAWTMRSGNGGGEEPVRLAAVIPLGTPEGESHWTTWIKPEECNLDPKAPSDVARLQSEESGDWPVPTYGPASKPSRDDAEAAATAARTLTSCFMYRTDGNYSSEPYLWRYTSPHSPLFDANASVAHQENNGREVSRELDDLAPSDLVVRTSTQPDQVQEALPVTYLPDQAIQFGEGRIGIPMAYLVPEGTSYKAPDVLYTTLSVFSNESGAWLLDDSLSVCVGDCKTFVDGGPWRGNNFINKSDIGTEWLTWIQPGECTAEPMTTEGYAEIMRQQPDISGRSYEVVGPTDPEMAEAVARTAREHEACLLYGDYHQTRSLETDAYVFFAAYSANRTISQTELHALNMEHAELLSRSLPFRDPDAQVVFKAETPPEEMPPYIPPVTSDTVFPRVTTYLGSAYKPDDAVMLADGRVAIPVTILYGGAPIDDPAVQQQVEQLVDEYTSIRMTVYVGIFSDASGSWKLDERLPSCQGDCDQYWNATIPSLIASPVATPEG